MILRPLIQPLVRPVPASPLEAAMGFSPRLLFASGEQGFLFINDISTMYQDSAGTIPAALEQPLGLWLDSKSGDTRGPELATTSAVNGVAIGGPALTTYPVSAAQTVANSTYEVSFTVSGYAGTSTVGFSNFNAVRVSANGDYHFITTASNPTALSAFTRDTNTCNFSKISIRELPGNHATQPTSANRPTATTDGGYQVESLDGLDDYITTSDGGQGTTGFFLCMALKVGKVGSVQTLVSDVGTNTGYRVRLNASNQLEIAAGNGTAFTTAATSDTVALNGSYVLTAWHDGATLNAQINSGGIGSASFSAASAGTAAVTIGRDNGAASNYTQGKIAQAVYVKNSIVTATVREQVKRYMASRLGVAL